MANPLIINNDNSVLRTGNQEYQNVTIKSGFTIVSGQVLGMITASQKYAPVDSTKTDGTKYPVAIAAVDVDASAADVKTTVIIKGNVDQSKLVFVGSDSLSTIPSGSAQSYLLYLHEYGIYPEAFTDAFIEDNQ